MKAAYVLVAVVVAIACGESLQAPTTEQCAGGRSGLDEMVGGKGGETFAAGKGAHAEASTAAPGAAGLSPMPLDTASGGAVDQAGAENGGMPVATGESGAGGEAGASQSTLPSEFEGLALWLEATEEACIHDEFDQVSLWSDASGNSNHAVQPALTAQPTLFRSVVNGHGALHFDDEPSALSIADSPTLRFAQNDFAYLFVMRWSNDHVPTESYTGAGGVLSKVLASYPYTGVAFFANYQSVYGAPSMRRFALQMELGGPLVLSYRDHLNDDMFRLYAARRVGNDVELRIDGASDARVELVDPLDVDAYGATISIGGWAGNQFRGDVAEVVVIGGSVGDEDLVRLERSLMEKYALRAD